MLHLSVAGVEAFCERQAGDMVEVAGGAHNITNMGECSGDGNNWSCRGRLWRRCGKKHTANGTVNHGSDDNDDDGWQFLRGEEEYQKWIRNFNEPVGYCGDNLTILRPLILSLIFWKMNSGASSPMKQTDQFFEREILKPNSRFHDWYDVTVPEIKAFMSVHLCIGLVEKSEIENDWAGFWLTYAPGVGKVMPRNSFFLSFTL